MIELTITDENRKKQFLEIFGTDTLPIKHYLPMTITVRETKEERDAYFLDLEKITKEQRDKLENYLSNKSGMNKEEVKNELDSIGFPILAEGTVVGIPLAFFI